jgi:D-alanyl-D-alanine carboxypeptidase
MLDTIINLILAGVMMQFPGAALPPQNLLSAATGLLPVAEQRIVPRRDFSTLSQGVKVAAGSYAVIEPESNKILCADNAEAPRPIASLTKLMTALVFLETNPDFNKEVSIEAKDSRVGGITYLIPGEKFKLRDVFFAALIASSNEGAAALSRLSGLPEADFVAKMNAKAVELGMTATKFADPTGLNNNNKSTAGDILKLAQAAFSRAEIKDAISREEYELSVINKKIKRKIKTTDRVLGDDFGVGGNSYFIKGGKTGYLESAGYCFVSEVIDSTGRRLLVAVLGSPTINDRFQDTKSLAYWAFNNFKW